MVKEGVMWMTIAVGWKTYFIVRVNEMSGVDEYYSLETEGPLTIGRSTNGLRTYDIVRPAGKIKTRSYSGSPHSAED